MIEKRYTRYRPTRNKLYAGRGAYMKLVARNDPGVTQEIWDNSWSEQELREFYFPHAKEHTFKDTGCVEFFLKLGLEDRLFTIDLLERVHLREFDFVFVPNEDGVIRMQNYYDVSVEQLMKERTFAGASWILSDPVQEHIGEMIANGKTRQEVLDFYKLFVVESRNKIPLDQSPDIHAPAIIVEERTYEERSSIGLLSPDIPTNAHFVRASVVDFSDWTASYQVFATTGFGSDAMLPSVDGLPRTSFYLNPGEYIVINVSDTEGNSATKRVNHPSNPVVQEDDLEDSNEQDEGE